MRLHSKRKVCLFSALWAVVLVAAEALGPLALVIGVWEFVARIGRLACGDGWRRRTTPSVALDPPCRSKPMLIAVTISPNSSAGGRSGPTPRRPCASVGA